MKDPHWREPKAKRKKKAKERTVSTGSVRQEIVTKQHAEVDMFPFPGAVISLAVESRIKRYYPSLEAVILVNVICLIYQKGCTDHWIAASLFFFCARKCYEWSRGSSPDQIEEQYTDDVNAISIDEKRTMALA